VQFVHRLLEHTFDLRRGWFVSRAGVCRKNNSPLYLPGVHVLCSRRARICDQVLRSPGQIIQTLRPESFTVRRSSVEGKSDNGGKKRGERTRDSTPRPDNTYNLEAIYREDGEKIDRQRIRFFFPFVVVSSQCRICIYFTAALFFKIHPFSRRLLYLFARLQRLHRYRRIMLLAHGDINRGPVAVLLSDHA
jgi:hypothetical protein